MTATRRLAAILVADVVGYSRLMEADEAGTLAALKDRRKAILEPVIKQHGGRVVKFMGDGALIEFGSAVNAVKCALELQDKFSAANGTLPDDRRIILRIGINLGDVIGEGSDIYGDGVNIAARLEALADPGGICVSAKVHDEVRGKIDATFEDMGEQALKNIAAPVRAFVVGQVQPGIVPATAVSTKPAVAVLPFDNMSGDPGQQYLSDGITEDIITELSRFKELSVAARYASFHHGRKGASLAQVARDLGVSHVVEGSVRKSGDQLRITVQLINAATGNHVWAERYDRDAQDIFAVQDQVVRTIVATLVGRMQAAGAASARKKPTASWTAYDLLLQGREIANNFTEMEGVALFTRAVEIDPSFALAQAWLAFGLLATYWYDARPETLNQAAQVAQKALSLDSDDATVHQVNALVMLWMRQYERARIHFDRAIALNPADAQIYADRANLLRYTGRPEEALAAIDEALNMSPFPPHWFWRVRGGVLFQLRRYAEVVDAINSITHKDLTAHIYLAAAQTYLGNAASAAEALALAKELQPDLSLQQLSKVSPQSDKEALDHFIDGLRKAGLPE